MEYNENIVHGLEELSGRFSGDIAFDRATRILYATDASAYRQMPLAVARPRDRYDIIELVEFATRYNTSLIPRTAGTSLAGQVVGGGIVVDTGRYMNRILEVNPDEKWVRVEPGVVLDELNLSLLEHGLFFSPETSTSNRCMIGGMVGNNSCGAHSLIHGSTRDHLLSVTAILSDGSEVLFEALTAEEFESKCAFPTLEGRVYRRIKSYLSNPDNQREIRDQFPDPAIKRRNTGYAIDLLLDCQPFNPSGGKFNFSKLLAGSEGTLAFFTEFKLHLDPLPPPVKGLVCVHCDSLEDALNGNLIALRHAPGAVELMDRTVMDLSARNLTQQKNRFFIKGDPAAILIVEFARNTEEAVNKAAREMEQSLVQAGIGTHYPLITGKDIPKVWAVRKAGLGLLSNMPGDARPVAVVEDTAVKVEDLPAYIAAFREILDRYGLQCAYNAHIGTGELHLRPILNLKTEKDVGIYRELALETAFLVKKFRGSLSGEHGDGRLRGEFLPIIIGEKNYAMLREIKRTWDPENIFNEGKIFDTPAMNTSLRYEPGKPVREITTMFDFADDQGFLRSAEKCNGSGDCRKTAVMGGTMCPSFQVTRDERDTTRARANILREMITQSQKENPFNHTEIFDVLDLCLSCKACKSECPSNVDMARLKAEFLHHYYLSNPMPFAARAMAHYPENYRLASSLPGLANFLLKNRVTAGLIKKILNVAPQRDLPLLYRHTLRAWLDKNARKPEQGGQVLGKVHFFVDEFTNYNDTLVGIKAIQLLKALGYEVVVPDHGISGRTYITKGMLHKARQCASINIAMLKDKVTASIPLIGIEPSTMLTFRDEYPDLLRGTEKEEALKLAPNVLLFDEFIAREAHRGKISQDLFTRDAKKIRLHGHCQQKAIASTEATLEMLSLPEAYEAEEIPSGCCGMAGSFGYEREHYELSMKVGELVLFPEVRKTETDVLIAASGTSCRHQIKDGTGVEALHPIEILYDALNKKDEN